MRNQLRAALYLLSRSAYLKGAVVTLTLYLGVSLLASGLSPYVSVAFDDLLQGGLSAVSFFSFLAAAGVGGHDHTGSAWRSACLAQRGRAAYVSSRILVSGLVATLLTTLVVALSLVGLVTSTATPGDASAGELALMVACGLLVAWVYAALGGWLAGNRSFANNVVLALLVTSGVLGFPVIFVDLVLWNATNLPFFGALYNEVIPFFLLGDMRGLAVAENPLRCLGLPALYLALIWVARVRGMAKREL